MDNSYLPSGYHSRDRNPNHFPINLLELSIETLLGTSYEVRLSPRTTIAFLKAKLQRREGIPKLHLHLVYRGKKNLKDSILTITLGNYFDVELLAFWVKALISFKIRARASRCTVIRGVWCGKWVDSKVDFSYERRPNKHKKGRYIQHQRP